EVNQHGHSLSKTWECWRPWAIVARSRRFSECASRDSLRGFYGAVFISPSFPVWRERWRSWAIGCGQRCFLPTSYRYKRRELAAWDSLITERASSSFIKAIPWGMFSQFNRELPAYISTNLLSRS